MPARSSWRWGGVLLSKGGLVLVSMAFAVHMALGVWWPFGVLGVQLASLTHGRRGERSPDSMRDSVGEY